MALNSDPLLGLYQDEADNDPLAGLYEEEPKKRKDRSFIEKSGRVAGQFALGAAESAALPYELAVAPLASQEAQQTKYREGVFEDIERLQEQKQTGVWDEKDQELLTYLTEQIKNPEKAKPFVKTTDIGIRGLAEKATGLDLHPEGTLEKAAHWTGFIKNPKNAKELVKMGTSPKELIKSIMPSGIEITRGLSAGTALQLAEEGKFGPLGTMGAAIVGDLLGGGAAGIGKALLRPKETLAKGAALLKTSKNAIKSDLKDAVGETKFTKDIGTLTENNIVQMIQARLTASGLTGKPLENLRKQMTKEVVEEYKNILDTLGKERFATLAEAGETGKSYLTSIRDAEKARIGELYTSAREALTETSTVRPIKLINTLDKIEKQLSPGKLKSTEQKVVLDVLEKLRSDIQTPNGVVKNSLIQDLMNDKIALNDIINFEVQGGQKQLLRQLVHEIDESLLAHGKENIKFVKNYVKANKDFAKHAKEFRNDVVDAVLRKDDPMTIINKMNSVQGIRDIRKAMSKTAEGKQAFNDIARKKIDLMIGDNLTDSVTEQLKSGKFVSLMHKPKNVDMLKELLPPESFKQLVRLEKHVGRLAESGQKFFNASQSATAASDLGIIGAVLTGLWGLFHGNPWIIGAGIVGTGVKLSANLIADPKFLKMVEESIIAAEKNDIGLMNQLAKNMKTYIEKSAPAVAISERSE